MSHWCINPSSYPWSKRWKYFKSSYTTSTGLNAPSEEVEDFNIWCSSCLQFFSWPVDIQAPRKTDFLRGSYSFYPLPKSQHTQVSTVKLSITSLDLEEESVAEIAIHGKNTRPIIHLYLCFELQRNQKSVNLKYIPTNTPPKETNSEGSTLNSESDQNCHPFTVSGNTKKSIWDSL